MNRRVLVAVATGLAGAILVTGVVVARSARADRATDAVWRAPGGPLAAAPGTGGAGNGSTGTGGTASSGLAGADWSNAPPPSRIRIPRIDIDAPLETLRLDAKGALEPPKDFGKPGWYADGTRPGEPGPSVVAGHVDTRDGPAVFMRLHELKAGDTVEISRGTAWVPFRVVRANWYPKSLFPTAEVYGPTPDAQLRLITCGGSFDRSRRSYRDNLVVYAVRA